MADDILAAAQKTIDAAVNQAHPAVSDKPDAIPPLAEKPPIPANQELPPEPLPEPVVPQTPPPPVKEKAPEAPMAAPPPVLPSKPSKVASETLVESILEPQSPSVVVPPPKTPPKSFPQKKSSPRGIILGVLALLLLALPIGVYYISQQNQQIAEIRSKATGPPAPYTTAPPGKICKDVTEPGGGCECQADGRRCCGYYKEKMCCDADGKNCQWFQTGTGQQCTSGPSDQCGGGGNTPTNTPPTTPVCQNIKIYKGGVQVTPSTLVAGDEVVLAVKGNLAPTKAHFRVNGGDWQETTTKNSGSEFTLPFTVPSGVTDFVIEGEVFTNGNWH